MRMRHLLLTSAACGALFATASYVPHANAQKGVFLSPVSQWAVTKVDGQGTGGGYCAVAKRYESDAIMTIARNSDTETSFALDLQKPVFSVSDFLEVTLDPGAGEQRTFKVEPVSSQAFVVKLGRDEPFFDAIDRTGILRVEAAGHPYVFNISDVDDGQTKLTACLASSVQPAAGDESEDEASLSISPFPTKTTSKNNDGVINELKERIASLKDQNDSLKDSIADIDVAATAAAPSDASTPEAQALRAENLRLKAALQTGDIAKQDEKIKLLEAENKRLRSSASQDSELSAQIIDLQERIDALIEENIALEQRSRGGEMFKLSSYEGDIKQLEIENASLRKALSERAERGELSSDMQRKIDDIERENRFLRERAVLDQDKIHNTYKSQVSALKMEIAALEAERSVQMSQGAEIEKLHSQILELRSDNALLQEDLVSKSAELRESAAQKNHLASLRERNAELKAAVEKSLGAHSLQEKAIKVLEKENRALKKEVLGVGAKVSEISALNQKLQSVQTKLEISLKKQAQQEARLTSLIEENDTLKQELELASVDREALVVAQQDIEKLQGQVEEKDALLDALKEGKDSLVAKLKESLEQLKAERIADVAALEDDLSRIKGESTTKIAELEDSILKIQSENAAALAAVIAEKDAALEKIEGDADSSIVVLKQELAQKNAFIEQLNTETQDNITRLQSELAEKDQAIAELQESKRQDIAKLEDALAQKDVALKKYDGVPHRLKKLLAAYKNSKEEAAELEQVILAKEEALQEKQKALVLAADEGAQQLQLQSEEQAVLAQKLVDQSKEKTDLALKLQAQTEQTVALSEELEVQKKEKAEAEKQLAEADARNKQFEEKLDALQRSVVAMSKINDEAKSLHVVLAQKQDEIERLKGVQQKLATAMSENRSLKDEKDKLILALNEALVLSEEKITALEEARIRDGEVIASLERNNSELKEESTLLLTRNTAEKESVEKENQELRSKLASFVDRVKQQSDLLKGKEEEYQAVLARNEVLRDQLDAASEVIASAKAERDEAVVQKASLQKKRMPKPSPKPSVVFVSAKAPAPSQQEVEVSRDRAPKTVAAKKDKGFAERLNDIMPAAGDEDEVSAEVLLEEDVIETPGVIEEAQDFMDRELNQAQIYEEQLKRSLVNEQRVEASREEAIDVETLEVDPVDAVIEEVAADVEEAEALLSDSVEEELHDMKKEPITELDVAAPGDEPVEVKMSADPFEGMKTADEGEGVKPLASEDVPLPNKVKQPKSQPAPTPYAAAMGIGAVERVLKTANIAGVTDMKAAENKGYAYQWRVGSLYGSAEQYEITSGQQFDDFVKEYLARTEERCPAEFAIVPDSSSERGGMRVDTYDVACVGDDVNASASLLFFNDGNVFTIIAHEVEAEKMSEAMAVRDRVFSSLIDGRDS